MDRREFLARAGLVATWAGVAIKVSGCSDDGGGDNPMDPGNGSSDVTGTVGNNHNHTVEITEAQLTAGVGVTLTLTEGSGHTHTLALSATEVMDIAAGTRVVKNSTFDGGHAHSVTFN